PQRHHAGDIRSEEPHLEVAVARVEPLVELHTEPLVAVHLDDLCVARGALGRQRGELAAGQQVAVTLLRVSAGEAGPGDEGPGRGRGHEAEWPSTPAWDGGRTARDASRPLLGEEARLTRSPLTADAAVNRLPDVRRWRVLDDATA